MNRESYSQKKRKHLKETQFYRQKPLGNYIIDFYCAKANLVIEIEGGQHYSEDGMQKEINRDEYLRKYGLKILRFSNYEIRNNLEAVLEMIYDNI